MNTIRLFVLAALLLTAVWTDVRSRRIPNWLTVSAAAVGLVLALMDGMLKDCLPGLLVGFAGGFALWMLKTFRAGDAKLLAALGALMGLRWLGLCMVWTFVAGAVLGLGLLLVKGQLIDRFRRLGTYCRLLILQRSFTPYQPREGTEREFPFAVAVALGAVLTWAVPL